jgi:hypothetical protein
MLTNNYRNFAVNKLIKTIIVHTNSEKMYNQQVLLTFDLGEFDIADEYGSMLP